MADINWARQAALKATALLVGVAVALVGLEILSTAWLTIRDGHYSSAAALFANARNTYIQDITRGGNCRYIDTMFPQPYLAFVHHHDDPCGVSSANDIGLLGDAYPVVRNPDRYVVLVTGGSVASQLAQQVAPPRRSIIEEELNRNYVSPTGKPFQVLNGGIGAWKQPQQMILLAIYGDFIDAVVTLDGYNEQHMIRPGVTYRFELPANNFLGVNPIISRDGFGNLAVSWFMGRIAGWLGNGITSHSHAAYLIASALTSKPYDHDDGFGAKTYRAMMSLPRSITDSSEATVDWQIAQYAKYIRIMDLTARDFGIKSMFFLQPVPAVDKTLTAEEKRGTPDPAYGARYAEIARRLLALRERHIEIRSLLDIYKDEKETIYADDIHPARQGMDSRGYQLMAARMTQDMAAAWGWRTKPQH
ncbi:MAG: hypothetical protein EPO41_14330 [Reyranella sp.]|uniref:hypothetical protein n=1 Tax=Reyranella sp. TaxID=1929291 RepID=UPI0012083F37|nr:hypothetical protein [Reyranella sp.]TAJ92087.1 MAG: hypothetical protein EPO41_14330 [Reyranella sp.]